MPAPTPQPPPLPPNLKSTTGLTGAASLDDYTEDRVDRIEMLGEEIAAGFTKSGASAVTPAMRYLHCSRTIHQLVTDRNRAVGIYLAVASLLWTASTALLNVKQDVKLIVPIQALQRWCVPVTLGASTVLALFTGFLLIRTRIGLLYEVAKMNALLGLPPGRVQRVNPLSIFFIMHLLVACAGGGSGTLFVYHLLHLDGDAPGQPMLWSVLAGVAITVLLVALYIGTVLYTTSDQKLGKAAG